VALVARRREGRAGSCSGPRPSGSVLGMRKISSSGLPGRVRTQPRRDAGTLSRHLPG
jgi:hypothetical protein